MNENIVVRKLTAHDLDCCISLRLESLQDSPTSFSSSYEEEKDSGAQFFKSSVIESDNNNLIFGAFIDDKLIGSLGIFKEKQNKAAHKCNFWGLYVKPQYRKQGFGKLLIKKAIEHAVNIMQCSVIKITLESDNAIAKKLYESSGFKAWGEEPRAMKFEGKFYGELHMILLV